MRWSTSPGSAWSVVPPITTPRRPRRRSPRSIVPYLAAHPVEFQTLQAWGANRQGLLPLESTMMVAIPELDGGDGADGVRRPVGRVGDAVHRLRARLHLRLGGPVRAMQRCPERAEALAARVARAGRAAPRRGGRAARRDRAVQLPAQCRRRGHRAFLAVFESLHATLVRLAAEGYAVEIPATVDDLREQDPRRQRSAVSAPKPTSMPVSVRIPSSRASRIWPKSRRQWGPAPGKIQADGTSVHILGARFGNVFVGIQPALGYRG